jgi:hypothetical protein
MNSKKKLAIVGIFYDGYLDLWKDFFALFKKFWPDCPYKLYVACQKTELNNDFTFLKAGEDAEYSKKVQTAVNEIDADYLLLILEDFFLSKPLDKNVIEPIFQYIIDNDIDYCAMPLPDFKRSYRGKKIKNTTFRKISPKAEYTVSCQPAIWKKDFLKKCVGELNYNAWIFEGVYSKAPFAHTEDFLKGCIVDKNNPLSIVHGAVQGKMLPKCVKTLRKSGYMLTTDRKVMSGSQAFKRQLKVLVSDYLPLFIRKAIKKRIKTSSVVDRYNEDIKTVIDSLGNGTLL